MPNFETGSALFSHNTDEWETPQNLFDKLGKEFHFGIDVCATHENAKCKNYFTKKDDGLNQNWGGTEQFGAIHLMEEQSVGGCGKHQRKPVKAIPQLC